MVYLFALILILIGVARYDYLRFERGKLFYIVLLFLVLVCISGFRYRLGSDSVAYSRFFDRTPTLMELRPIYFDQSRFAAGFVLFTSFCKTISGEFAFMQFLLSLILNSVVFRFFYKNTKHFFFAVLLYYFFLYTDLNFEVLREMLSVSVFLLAWPFFREGKWLWYYGMCILASFFHLSAFFLFLLPVICIPGVNNLFKYGKRTFIIGIFVLAIGFAINHYFIDFIRLIAFSEAVDSRADLYSKSKMGGSNSLNIAGIIMTILRLVLYPCLAMYALNKIKAREIINSLSFQKIENLSIASIYISLLSITVFILMRFNNYLLFFPILLISDWVFTEIYVSNKRIRLQFVSWFIFFLPLFVSQFYSLYFYKIGHSGIWHSYMKYYPYESIFTNELDRDREKIIKYVNR